MDVEVFSGLIIYFIRKKLFFNFKSLIISRTHKVSICIEICYKTLRKLDVGPNLKSKVGVIFNLNLKVNKKVVLSLWSPVAVFFCVLKEDRASVDSFLIPSSLTLFYTPHG